MSLNNLDKFRTKKPQFNSNNGGSGEGRKFVKYVSVQPDNTQLIKFLDEGNDDNGFYLKYFHTVRRPNRWGNMSTEYKLCLDQENDGIKDCPWCDKLHQISNPKENQQYRRSAQLMTNVLLKDAPIVKKEGNQWVTVGTEDKVQVYRCGITMIEEIQRFYTSIGSIKNTWFELSRTGSGKEDTRYTLSPLYDGRSIKDPEDNTPSQQALVDENYVDLPDYFYNDSISELGGEEAVKEAVSEDNDYSISANPLKRN